MSNESLSFAVGDAVKMKRTGEVMTVVRISPNNRRAICLIQLNNAKQRVNVDPADLERV